MIKRTFDITARIEQGNIPYCFQVVQNDKDVYALRIRITEGDKEIDYTQVSDATITFALANGTVVQSDPERLAISSGGITYEMGTTEISCPGKVLASIQLFGEDGERLTTARFQFEVVADLISPGAVQSESHFPLLQQLVADVEQLKQDIVDLQIPDGSIMDVKLSDAAGQIKQRMGKIKIIGFDPGSGTIDLDTLTEPCLYRFAGTVPVINGPYEIMGDQTMLVTGGVMSFQITIKDGEIVYRNSFWNGDFGPWYKITGTNVSHLKEVTRDVSISGVQTITLPFKPKSLICIASVGQKAFSIGFWAENNAQFVKSICLDTPETFKNAQFIYLRNASGYIVAKVQNVTETGFEINWDESTGISGVATLYILASTH